MSRIPGNTITLLRSMFQKIFPMVDEEIGCWKSRAKQIPNEELRTQALASIRSKKFHCQGGGVYSLLAGNKMKEAITFIIAYQTISDYLDNLCDRSTSLDPRDFEMLHQAMKDALSPGNERKDYYHFRTDQDDGGYLHALVETCQLILEKLDGYEAIRQQLMQLEKLYSELQVHKHVKAEERIPRLTAWYEENKEKASNLSWYEFSAAAGSTLGIYCLVSYALGNKINNQIAENVFHGYFPYVQGLHILLDYYIDQQEDMEEGDLNFCRYYSSQSEMQQRILFFIKQSNQHVKHLPDRKFHEMIVQGLVGLYLADDKLKKIKGSQNLSRTLLKASGTGARFINFNIKFYYRMES
nr:tetraprenyl-beta-curcumene synthase family protein [Oceanobacillus damuensis]